MTTRGALWLVLTGCLILSAAAPALAQRKRNSGGAPTYKVGQRVMVNSWGDWVPGIVTSVDRFATVGRIEVKTKDHKNGWPYDLSDIRPLPKKPAAETAESAAAADPFATDEEKFDRIGRRTWSDTTGKFKVEARIARLQGDAVVLRRADGKEITVPVAKLSPDDQQIVRNLLGPSRGDSEVGESTGEDNWFEEEEFLNAKPAAAPDVKTLEIDTAKAKPLDLGSGVKWTYSPRPAAGPPASPVRIALGPKRDFFDSVSQILFSPDMGRGFVIIGQGHRHEKPPRVIACDLKEGAVSQQGEFFSGQLPLAISPNGQTLVARSDGFGFGKSSTLYVHQLDGYKATPKFAWQPYALHDRHGRSQDVAEAVFVDDQHLLTMSEEGVLYIWGIGEQVKPLYFGHSARRSSLALGANGDCLAVRSESGVALIEPTTGKSLGLLPAPERSWQAQLAIRRDGRRLALAEGGRFRIWDLSTQELIRDFSVSNVSASGPIAWADDQRLMVGGSLIDVEKRVLLWSYSGVESVVCSAGGLTWAVSGEHSASSAQLLIGAALPHAEAKAAADSLDAEEVLVIKPGMEVGIQLQFAGSVADQEIVRKALSQRLEEVGLKPVGQSAVMLTASITPGESETIQYQAFGSNQVSQHTVTKKVLELALSVSGKKVWRVNSQTWAPHVVHMQKGESIDQAIAREMNIDPKQFQSMFVPGYVAKPKDDSGAAYGTSKIPGAL